MASRNNRVNPKEYAKNVLKSAGYIATTTIKGVNPTLTSFISDNASAAKDMYKSVREHKFGIKSKLEDMVGKDNLDSLKKVKGYVLDDLRTGKFYNKEREDQSMNKLTESMGLSFDFDDIDFDVDDKDVEDSGSSSSDSTTTNAVLTIGDKIAFTQRASTELSSDKIVTGSRKNSRMMMVHNERLFGQINSSLSVINTSIMNLHRDLAGPLNTHIINSSNFYNTATAELAKQTSYLESIHNMLSERFKPASSTSAGSASRKKTPWESIMGGELPDLVEWFKSAKNKAVERSSLSMIKDMVDPEMMSMFINGTMGSPISFALTTILQSKLQNGPTGKALDRTVNIIRDGMTKFAADISAYNKKSGGRGILGTLASLFDIAPDQKTRKLDFSQYNKGRADWTGKDSRALQVVIPTQLAKILSALTGKEAEMYDYNTGRFVSASRIVRDFKSARKSAIASGSGSLKNDILNDFIESDKRKNAGTNTPSYTMRSRATISLGKDYDTLISMLTLRHVDMSQFNKKGDIIKFCQRMGWIGTGSGPYILSYKNVVAIDNAIFRSGVANGKLVSASYSSRIAYNNFRDSIAGTNMELLANGSGLAASHKNNINLFSTSVDESGKNIWFYLQSYHEQLREIANKFSYSKSSRGTSKKGLNRASSRGSTQNNTSQISTTTISDRVNDINTTKRNKLDEIDPEGRYEYNALTEEYEAPKATSRASREKEEKTSIISRGIDKINNFLSEVIFGNTPESIREKIANDGGLMGFLKKLPEHIGEAVQAAKDKVKQFVSDKWKQFKESDFGKSFFGDMKESITNYAKDTWNYAKTKGYELIKGKRPPWEADVSGAYKGGYVRKSGMASVSEGELIVPAEYNPFYKGKMSTSARKTVEKKNYEDWLEAGGEEDDFFGFFRKGGTVKKKRTGQWTKLTEKDKETIRKLSAKGYTAEEIARKISRPIPQVKSFMTSNNLLNVKDRVVEEAEDAVEKVKESEFAKKISGYASQAADAIYDGIERIFGNNKAYQDLKGTVSETVAAAKVDLPKTMATGALGALVGAAVTGSGLGLLGGFAVGAGATILKNSSTLSEKLFGKFDGKEWKDGLLPPKVTKFIKERLPSVGKAAGAGAVIGALGLAPGGIFGGLVLGAGLEMVSTTTKFKDIMFGPEDVNGKRNGGILGAIKVNAVDPLIRFVKDGIQHVGDYVKKNFLNPLGKIFDPLKDWVKGKSRRILDGIVDSAKEVVKRTVGERFAAIFKPVANAVGNVGKRVLRGAGAIASAPFKLVGAAGEALERHNIRVGYSSKTAQERMSYEGKQAGLRGLVGGAISRATGGVASRFKNKLPSTAVDTLNNISQATSKIGALKNTEYTRWAANASDQDILDASTYLNGATDLKNTIITKRQNLANLVTASLVNGGAGNPKEVKEIKKLFNTNKVVKDNDFSDVIAKVQSLDESLMGSETKKKVIDKINEYQANLATDIRKRDNFKTEQEAFLKKLGFTSPRQLKYARTQSRIDAKNIMKKSGTKDNEEIEKAKSADDAAKLLKEQEKADPMGAHLNNSVDSIKDLLAGIAKKIGVTGKDVPSNEPGASDENESINTAQNIVEKVLSTSSDDTKTKEKKDEPNEGDERTEFKDGNPIKFVFNKGKWVHDTNDPATSKYTEDQENDRELRNKFYGMFVSGGLLNSLKGLFSKKSDDEDKKSGSILDTIASLFGGDGESSGVGGVLKNLLSKILPVVGGIAGAYVISKVGENTAGTGKDSGMYAGADAEQRKAEVKDKNIVSKFGLGLDSLENSIRGRDTTTYEKDDFTSQYFSESSAERMGKNFILSFDPKYAERANKIIKNTIGKVPVVGKVAAAPFSASTKIQSTASKLKDFGTKVAQNTSSLGKKASTVASNIKSSTVGQKVATLAQKAGSKIASTGSKVFGKIAEKSPTIAKAAKKSAELLAKLKSTISNVFNILVKKLGLKAAAGSMDDVVESAAKTIIKKGGAKLAAGLAKIVPIITVVFIVNAVVDGFQSAKAKTILGILDEPTIMQRILAAACNGLNEAIPGIGGLIPTEILFTIVYTALELLGCDFGELSKQRAEAKATVEAYNKENGTTYNIEEYIHNVLGEYTIQQRIGKAISSAASAVVNWGKNVGKNIANFFTGGSSGNEEKESDKAVSKFENGYSQNNRFLNEKNTSPSSKTSPTSTTNSNSSRSSNSNMSKAGTYSDTVYSTTTPTANTGSNSVTSTSTTSSSSSVSKPSKSASPAYSTTRATAVAMGSGVHTTQKGNFRRFGKSTIDETGCGPAVASTVLKAYGKNVDIDDAANYAENRGYVAGASGANGTRASYFEDIFERNGIDSAYVENKKQIQDAIDNGSPTVLLGQDNNNTSKSNSPFGPNPHYVVARGSDKNGNIIVDDPELKGTALYKRNILNKTKLGVTTGGDSGVSSDTATTSTVSSGVSGLVGSFFSNIISSAASKLGDSPAGKIMNFIFGGNNTSSSSGDNNSNSSSSSSSSYSSDTSSSSYSSYSTSSYSGKSPFPVLNNVPSASDPYIKFYNNSNNGGVSKCINGKPTDSVANVLNNCVGWASARFNHIYALLSGTKEMKYAALNCNAESFIERAQTLGLKFGDTPQPGAIMVWSVGTIGNGDDGAGHVAIVEEVKSDTEVVTSESGYNTFRFKNITRKKGNGNWGESSSYKFRAFIYNPAVEKVLAEQAAATNTYNPKNVEESKKTIWKFMRNNGFTEEATAGAMGCWQSESGNKADTVEGYYYKSYPGNDAVLSSPKSMNDWTLKLFDLYKNNGLSINQSAYKASDGNYYAGMGLAQWTGPRTLNLINYAKSKGKNYRNLETQLDFFLNGGGEFKDRAGLKEKMNNVSSPEDAATTFLDGFEMYNGWHNTSRGQKQNAERRSNAAKIYNDLKGMPLTTQTAKPAILSGQTMTAMGSGINTNANGRKIPIEYNFTESKKSSDRMVRHHIARSRGSASYLPTVSYPETSGMSMDNKIDTIALYLSQIASNTANNAAIPTLVQIMKQSLGIIANIGNNSMQSLNNDDATTIMNNEINLMRSKLEAIAQTM